MIRKLLSFLPTVPGKMGLIRLIDELKGPTIINTSSKVKFKGFYSNSQDIAFIENDNVELIELINELSNEAIFIDIGANIGFFSAILAIKPNFTGKIFSFEPSLREFEKLIFTKKSNKTLADWTLFNFGLGSENKLVKINTNNFHTGINHIDPNGNQNCLLLSLDTLEIFNDISIIDLVKIDVEGFEVDVLKGMKKLLASNKIQKLQIEITEKFLNKYNSSKMELYEIMNFYGYISTINSVKWQYNEIFLLHTKSK